MKMLLNFAAFQLGWFACVLAFTALALGWAAFVPLLIKLTTCFDGMRTVTVTTGARHHV